MSMPIIHYSSIYLKYNNYMNTHSSYFIKKLFVYGERIPIKYIFMEKIILLIGFEAFVTKYKKTLKLCNLQK